MNYGKAGEQMFSLYSKDLGYQVEDLSSNPAYWDLDIDFRLTNPRTSQCRTFEVKTDTHIQSTGNLYIELTNIHSKQGKGWFEFCKADYLAYIDYRSRALYIIDMEELRAHISSHSFSQSKCGDDSTGLLVPLATLTSLPSFQSHKI